MNKTVFFVICKSFNIKPLWFYILALHLMYLCFATYIFLVVFFRDLRRNNFTFVSIRRLKISIIVTDLHLTLAAEAGYRPLKIARYSSVEYNDFDKFNLCLERKKDYNWLHSYYMSVSFYSLFDRRTWGPYWGHGISTMLYLWKMVILIEQRCLKLVTFDLLGKLK